MAPLGVFVALLASVAIRGSCGLNICSSQALKGGLNGGGAKDMTAGRRVIGASPAFTFDCCGVLTRFEAATQNSLGFQAEIWRPTTYNMFDRIWHMSFPNPGNNLNQPIAAANSVTVHSGDVIGWYSGAGSGISLGNDAENSYFTDGAADGTSSVTVTSGNILAQGEYQISATAGPGNAPRVTNAVLTTSLPESATSAGAVIFTVTVSDDDEGQNTTLVLTKTAGSLDLDGYTIKAPSDLEEGTYTITVKVEDECTLSSTTTFTLTVTNTAPTITNLPGTATVDEDVSVQTSLFPISTSDADNDVVSCDFATGTPAYVTNIFQVRVEPYRTAAYALYVRAGAGLDYDARPSYSIDVTCTDGSDSYTDTLTVNVQKNSAPTFLNLPGSANTSSGLSRGSTVFMVSATDAEKDQMNYTMACTPSNPFRIYPSGAVVLEQSILGTTTSTYTCSVTVFDSRGSTGPNGLTIYISDLKTKPILQGLPTTVSLDENSAGGTLVHAFNVTDPDGDTAFSYQLAVDPSSGSVKFVSVDSANQLILAVGESLDYESDPTSYVISVTAFDGYLTSDTKTLTVTVNDVNEAPVLDDTVVSYFITNRENVAGTVLPDPGYQFTDPDAGDSHTFSLAGGVDSSILSVDPTTGRISFAIDYDVDQNNQPEVIVPLIEIKDSGGLAVTATVTVSISDYNDNAPTFPEASYVTSMLKHAALDTQVFSLAATDLDSGTNAQVKYSLSQAGNLDQTYFGVTDAGQVYVLRSCSELSVASVIVNVTATDQGSPQLSGSYKLTILLLTVTKGFLSYPGNVAWLSALCVLGGAALLLLAGLFLYRHLGGRNILDALSDWYRRRKERLLEEERQRDMRRREKEDRRLRERPPQQRPPQQSVSPNSSSYRPPVGPPGQNNANPYDVVKYNNNYDATRFRVPASNLNGGGGGGSGPASGSYEFWNAGGAHKF